MIPRAPLPRLTLFTGGKECSLCEVAKQDLAIIRQSHPFDITLWNIRSPPAGVDEWEAKKWRRLYQYDIPVLHLDNSRIQKHRIDKEKLKASLEEWHSNRSNSVAGGWKSYRSVLGSITPAKRRGSEYELESNENSTKASRPPWRRKVGSAWFTLDSATGIGEGLNETEGDEFARILENTFCNFSHELIGPTVIADTEWERDEAGSFIVDVTPQKQIIIGEIAFDADEADDTSKLSHRPLQTCWNCDEPGHSVSTCPQPRNYAMINARRAAFTAEKEAVPESAMRWWRDYRFTEKERSRRLKLVDRFVPGRISPELADAIFYVEPRMPRDGGDEAEGEDGEIDAVEEEREMMERKKERREWPWLYWMLKWGYPPGYFCDKDPIEWLGERIRTLPIDIEDEGDLLKIFGGDLGGPGRSATPSSSSDDTSGLPITPARKTFPEEETPLSPVSEDGSDMILDPQSPLQVKLLPPPPSSPPPPPPDSSPPLMSLLSGPPGPSWRSSGPMSTLSDSWTPPRGPKWQPSTGPRALPKWCPVRWATYPTHLFDSSRLKVYAEWRPLPVGF